MYHSKKRKHIGWWIALTVAFVLLVLAAAVLAALHMSDSLVTHSLPASRPAQQTVRTSSPVSVPASDDAVAERLPPNLPDEMRAMWIAHPDWDNYDISTESAMRETAKAMFDNCKELGLNTVIVAVRPFGDALYKSEVYPWSHLITGVQGQDPGYDPLTVLVEEAHARGLRIEAYINPYRISNGGMGREMLSADNPAMLHPDWVREVSGGLWYDPALPEVQQLVVHGVQEIVRGYDVDGIHFDDYFYPEGKDSAFDEDTYQQLGQGEDRDAWRRENVNTLVRAVYEGIKQIKPDMPFGISPQGNNTNNYNMQCCDVLLWMRTPGYIDYVMPQNYWGFGYTGVNGDTRPAFENKCTEWAGYERSAEVRLYNGLAVYRVGFGDGGVNDQSEWYSGHNVADQIEYARGVEGFSGFALFRYGSLFANGDVVDTGAMRNVDLAISEREAIQKLLGE